MNAPEEFWLNMNPKGASSNGLDKETHLKEGNARLTGFTSDRWVFVRFGVHADRQLTGCSRVVYLPGFLKGAAARFALLLFFKTFNKGRLNLALSGVPAPIKLAVVVVVVC